MSRVKDFLYYFMITPLITLATFLFLLLFWGANKTDELYWFLNDFTPRAVLFWFFMGIVSIVGCFLVYSFVRFGKSLATGDLSTLFETLLIGIPMALGVVILVHFLFWSGGFESVIENISNSLFK